PVPPPCGASARPVQPTMPAAPRMPPVPAPLGGRGVPRASVQAKAAAVQPRGVPCPDPVGAARFQGRAAAFRPASGTIPRTKAFADECTPEARHVASRQFLTHLNAGNFNGLAPVEVLEARGEVKGARHTVLDLTAQQARTALYDHFNALSE